MDNKELLKIYAALKNNPNILVEEAARKRLINFARYMQDDLSLMPFHIVYYTLLDKFAHGEIKKMIVQMPPQHGKSEGSSRKLPAFMLGLNPDLKICIGSYAATIARDFNRDVQRIIDTPRYHKIFPNTYLNGSNVVTMANTYLRNSDVIEIVGKKGSLRVVGRGGSLTSKTVDVSILDDVYKDYAEGNSPVVRNAAWKWYTTVVRTRLHNNSQELIVFTRWHEDDLIGRIEKSGEKIIDIKTWNDITDIPAGAWVRINFEGLKSGDPTEIDPRECGVALWENRHSREKLEGQKAWIESNNGGSSFEKVITKKVRAITVPFYQKGNKESRIITSSAMVNSQIIMPFNWENRYKDIYNHITTFLRDFSANTHDDPEDALTGVYEKELSDGNIYPYSQATRGVKRRN